MNGELSRASKSYFDVDDDDALGAERSVGALFGLTDSSNDVALRATVSTRHSYGECSEAAPQIAAAKSDLSLCLTRQGAHGSSSPQRAPNHHKPMEQKGDGLAMARGSSPKI
jgi:hypothetical protein